MEAFRISRERYANQLNSSGIANRWNFDQEWVIYTSSSRSLATLELVVHSAHIQPGLVYKTMIIHFPDDKKLITEINPGDLPKNWRELDAYPKLQRMGSEWYHKQQSLILKVPSAVILAESNYVINTKHPDFTKKVQLKKVENYFWDERLL